MKKRTLKSAIQRKAGMLLSCIRDFCKGLDFTIPDRMYDRGRNDGAMYYATPEKLLNGVLQHIDPSRYPAFLDIGCGKGFVLRKAWEYGFSRVTGVDYDEKMIAVCQRNMKKLGLSNAVQALYRDACQFEDYGDYDVFYFFNPFPAATMQAVIQRIIEQCAGKEIILIYFRPRFPESIEESGLFDLTDTVLDKSTGYTAHIYRGHIPSAVTTD